ncbi:hypothetical protein Ppa06_57160 [Planomonospora parontospora subsp. parontospora]|uniref:Uncharacterized protein n=2 Tax=Planomonospora parontospora TaxID=58119 RepID=A0AA37BLY7_9ACTN|nr:hypothetical protein [Planomonospora parontospora]GGK91078.1 hypothetical protein GCM10010126_58140 [Planomonospora parontospora]GII11918.1 hypothetical protein Ppa06_57160 [Planomonospora parontospora subsp. parontospora]
MTEHDATPTEDVEDDKPADPAGPPYFILGGIPGFMAVSYGACDNSTPIGGMR